MKLKQLICNHEYWNDYKIDVYYYKASYPNMYWVYEDMMWSRWRIFTCEKCWKKKLQKLKDIHK